MEDICNTFIIIMGNAFASVLRFLTPSIRSKISISCACFKSVVEKSDNGSPENAETDEEKKEDDTKPIKSILQH
jgi:hypothetical protein